MPRIRADDEAMEKIHIAARKNQLEVVKKLVESGVDADIRNKFGCGAVSLAIKFGCLKTLAYLAPISDLSVPWHGRRPLALCMEAPRPLEVADVLLRTLKEQGKDAANFINECDDFEKVLDLTPYGLEPRKVQGETILHACVMQRNVDMLKLLLALGGTANAKDRQSETVLMRAVEIGGEHEFALLVAHPETRVDSATREGKTPLHMALMLNRPEMAKKLLELGADVNMEDQDKNTALTHAMRGGHFEILESILPLVDPFTIQSSNFHNGVNILPERIDFRPHVDDAARTEVIKVMQKKLDIMREKDKPEDGSPKKKKKKQ